VPVSTTSDALLGPDGDLPQFTSLVTGLDALAQRVSMRLQLHLGEWFANPSTGLPWSQWSHIKPLPSTLVALRVRAVLETVPGITAVRDIRVAQIDRSMTIDVDLLHGRDVVELGYSVDSPGRHGNTSFYIRYRRLGSSLTATLR
jgi:hypothetical protein